MKIWVHINGVQEGPFEPNELPLDRMNAETPVWYEGLEYWMPAGNTELTAHYFNDEVQAANANVQNQQYNQGGAAHYGASGYGNRQYARSTQPTQEERPATYIIWSVLLTVLCCNPIGIVPLILGCTVNSKMRNFDYDGARRASESTAWWLMITIVTSIILCVFSPLMML